MCFQRLSFEQSILKALVFIMASLSLKYGHFLLYLVKYHKCLNEPGICAVTTSGLQLNFAILHLDGDSAYWRAEHAVCRIIDRL